MRSFTKTIALFLLSALSLSAGVYENLEYGDSKEEVTNKLMACDRLENTAPQTMFGRVGLNGTFRIRKDLDGLNFALYFGWDDENQLDEVILRSAPIPAAKFNSTLRDAFQSAKQLITEMHGAAAMTNPMPTSRELEDGMILNSHLWHVDGGSLLLGIAKEQGKLNLSISFLDKHIKPIRK